MLARARVLYFRKYSRALLPVALAFASRRSRVDFDKHGRPLQITQKPRRSVTPRAIAQARKLHREFTGQRSTGGRNLRLKPLPRAGVVLGRIIEIGYESSRDSRPYRHAFRASSRPLLVASHDGTQALIVGGRFAITGRGIEDR